MGAGNLLAKQRVGGRLIDNADGDLIAYLLIFAGVAGGIATTQFFLFRWDDPINLGVAGVVLAGVALANRLR